MSKYTIGIDLGGTTMTAGIVNENYEIVGKLTWATRLPRPAEDLEKALAEGKTLTEIGIDTMLQKRRAALEAAARDADLLCMDATYADDADLPTAELYGHDTCREDGALAAAANVRRLWLTHYSAAVTDPAPGLSSALTAYPAEGAGYDGLTEELEFDREP